jgi:hypothetical protein
MNKPFLRPHRTGADALYITMGCTEAASEQGFPGCGRLMAAPGHHLGGLLQPDPSARLIEQVVGGDDGDPRRARHALLRGGRHKQMEFGASTVARGAPLHENEGVQTAPRLIGGTERLMIRRPAAAKHARRMCI